MINETNVLIFSLLGGIIPALFWLWFWIREDRLKPEPKSALLSAFIGGVLAVFFALFFELVIYYVLVDGSLSAETRNPAIFWLPLQHFIEQYSIIEWQDNVWTNLQNTLNQWSFAEIHNLDIKKIFLVVIMAPVIEEILKLLMTYSFCLRRKYNDEPIDPAIYLLTAALGFAAIETALFLTEPLAKGEIIDTLIAGNFRSIGPMLIHLVSSALLGIYIGLAFYKSKIKKFFYLLFGLLVAILTHALFNFFIMLNEKTKNITFFWVAVIGTWILVVVLLIFFERIKKVRRKKQMFYGIIKPNIS